MHPLSQTVCGASMENHVLAMFEQQVHRSSAEARRRLCD